ncbi:thiamine phosphate synthase [Mycobacteroides salmoniphilum]|uniref:Thiamine-phosphate synthase n=1 Tax=Mycobacteroides salmoniphilum TaxID=404941 RepID=A0A4R8SV24_9MYCO|nr:thiamine phosphate synthase [Mycobacteroides salmoniphilum]TDZ98841.1 Thiamine-phosphate synthase [Mycobacteroides salmoniphilum]TEA06157.1 Thiamine-phosphate synthase [Mycobacteroides salmoniphilum]
MHPRSARLESAHLYLCTDARRERGDLAEFVDAALAGGVDVVQLRDKGSVGEQQFGRLEPSEELDCLAILGAAAARHGALFAVNDRADIARAAGADILHLGQDDLPLSVAREIVGPDVLIGRSTHDADQAAAAAEDAEVDYFCCGPCWPTPTKPGRTAPGLGLVRTASELGASQPWFAIGGIDGPRVPEVVAAGASRIVVVRAITAASDPRAAAASLRGLVLHRA